MQVGKVYIRLPGKGNSMSHGARPVHKIISMIKWIWTSRFSIKKSLCAVWHLQLQLCAFGEGVLQGLENRVLGVVIRVWGMEAASLPHPL